MKVEIVSINDENFNIKVAQMGEVFVSHCGGVSCIGGSEKDAVEGLVETIKVKASIPEEPSEFIRCRQGCGCVDVCEETIDPPQTQQGKPAVPLENHRETNSFDYFSGTSWGGNKQSF